MATQAKATISNLTPATTYRVDNGTTAAVGQVTSDEVSPMSAGSAPPLQTQALLDSSIRLIYYSESEDKSKRVSFIPFNRIVAVTPVTDPEAINSAKAGWVYGLELETVDRLYELWARTAAEAKHWLLVLEKASSIGKAASASSHYSVNSSILSSTAAYKVDPLQPPIAAATLSRRGSANSSQAADHQQDTVPIVGGPPLAPQKKIAMSPMSDNMTVDIAAGAGVRSPSMKVAPAKWDDWDK